MRASRTKILRFLPNLHNRAPASAIFWQWKMAQKKKCGSTVRASGRWTNFKVWFFHSNTRRPLEPFTASITPAICTAHALPFDSHMWTDWQSLRGGYEAVPSAAEAAAARALPWARDSDAENEHTHRLSYACMYVCAICVARARLECPPWPECSAMPLARASLRLDRVPSMYIRDRTSSRREPVEEIRRCALLDPMQECKAPAIC